MRRKSLVLIGFLLIFTGVASAQTYKTYSPQIQVRATRPGAPSIVTFQAPERIIPSHHLPVYVAAKAGDSDLKDIVWNFYCCGSQYEGGAYHVKEGEGEDLDGKFFINTLSVLNYGSPFRAAWLVLHLSVWAVDQEGRSSEKIFFDVTLDPTAPDTFPPPEDGRTYAKDFGDIKGHIFFPQAPGGIQP